VGHLQRDQMGFYRLWRPPLISPYPLASNVRKHYLPIRFCDLVILRLCFHNQLLAGDCDHDHGGGLSLALWEGPGAFPYVYLCLFSRHPKV